MNNLVKLPLKIVGTLPENTILLGYRGSQAHGTYMPSSNPDSIDDIDLMGVFIGPKEHYLGFGRRETLEQWVDEYDCVYYELRKLMGMLMQANPNVLSLLYLEDKHTLYRSDLALKLIENRELFSSKVAFNAFCGYARGQLKKMEHVAEKDPAILEEYDDIQNELRYRKYLSEGRKLPDVERKFYNIKTQQLRERSNQIQKHSGYMGRKRRDLVDRFGYDTKNAAHLIRLLRMGGEFLDTGKLTVERSDAQDFIDIKRGLWSLEKVKEEADKLFAINEEKNENSPLPEVPNKNKVERLCVDLVTEFHTL